ncbi:hypothetical protein F2Q69_00034955 [Brassica cretica]|uniref:Uncharacterized protein n=1 Tax=Brassica cretica TaxID=69181 RepID=A0A8S9SU72_BRACR|nr:hypothetical protein F2Q69_00034955 [Brassica cretica]
MKLLKSVNTLRLSEKLETEKSKSGGRTKNRKKKKKRNVDEDFLPLVPLVCQDGSLEYRVRCRGGSELFTKVIVLCDPELREKGKVSARAFLVSRKITILKGAYELDQVSRDLDPGQPLSKKWHPQWQEWVCSSLSMLSKLDEAIQIEVPIVRLGPTTRSGSRAIRAGFSKAVQQILDQHGQTGQNQLLIEEMIQLKIEDQAGPIEVQDHAGPIQFKSLGQNRTGQIISTCDLGSDSSPIQSGINRPAISPAHPPSRSSVRPIRSVQADPSEPQSSHL